MCTIVPYYIYTLQDDDTCFDEPTLASSASSTSTLGHGHNHSVNIGVCSQPKMPPYPIGGYMVSGIGDSTATAANTSGLAGKGPSNANTTTTTNTTQVPTTLATRVTRRTSK